MLLRLIINLEQVVKLAEFAPVNFDLYLILKYLVE